MEFYLFSYYTRFLLYSTGKWGCYFYPTPDAVSDAGSIIFSTSDGASSSGGSASSSPASLSPNNTPKAPSSPLPDLPIPKRENGLGFSDSWTSTPDSSSSQVLPKIVTNLSTAVVDGFNGLRPRPIFTSVNPFNYAYNVAHKIGTPPSSPIFQSATDIVLAIRPFSNEPAHILTLNQMTSIMEVLQMVKDNKLLYKHTSSSEFLPFTLEIFTRLFAIPSDNLSVISPLTSVASPPILDSSVALPNSPLSPVVAESSLVLSTSSRRVKSDVINSKKYFSKSRSNLNNNSGLVPYKEVQDQNILHKHFETSQITDSARKFYLKKVDSMFVKDLLIRVINEFWHDVILPLKDSQYVILIIKVQDYKENKIWSYDKILRFTPRDYLDLIERIIAVYESLGSRYKNVLISNLILIYWVRDIEPGETITLTNKKNLIKLESNLKLNNNKQVKKFNKAEELMNFYDLLNNNHYWSWGKLMYRTQDGSHYILQDAEKLNRYYYVYKHKDHYNIEIKVKNELIVSFTDSFTHKPDNIFVRTLDNYVFYINNHLQDILLKTCKLKVDHLKPISKERKNVNRFITLDLETQVINNEHVPYCICFFDGENKYSFYISDYSTSKDMLVQALKGLLRPKYSGFVVYVHNLSHFDGVFLISVLSDLLHEDKNLKIKPVMREGEIINIKINYGPKSKYTLSIRDSYLLLPLSLAKLSVQFAVDHPKSVFPHSFLNDQYNKNIDINYIGLIPHIMYFEGLSKDTPMEVLFNNFITDYLKDRPGPVKNSMNNWSLREEAIKYCLTDCISLYEVLIKFNKVIFDKFKLNIQSFPTLPSLTFGIFRANYLIKLIKLGYNIPLLKEKIYQDIKLSYTGGSTDMFIPYLIDTTVFAYDINSLYPANMTHNKMMPVVSTKKNYLTYFIGDLSVLDKIYKNQDKPFGFFEVSIRSTERLEHPIMQVKWDTGNGKRTISPLGQWNGWYFSEELYNSLEYGYRYEVHRGYIFEKHPIGVEPITPCSEDKRCTNSAKDV